VTMRRHGPGAFFLSPDDVDAVAVLKVAFFICRGRQQGTFTLQAPTGTSDAELRPEPHTARCQIGGTVNDWWPDDFDRLKLP
jgi:hypothetical protein